MAGKKHATGKKGKGGTSISVTFSAGISAKDKAKAKKAINKIKGATVKVGKVIDAPHKAVAGGIKKAAKYAVSVPVQAGRPHGKRQNIIQGIKRDLAGGRKTRDEKMKATVKKGKLAKQKATRKALYKKKPRGRGVGGG